MFFLQIHTKIEADSPVKLVALHEPGMATVSNTKSVQSRYIVRNLHLQLTVGVLTVL